MKYIIEVPLDEAAGTWRQLCICTSGGGVAEVIKAILIYSENPPVIRVVPVRT